LYSFDEFSSPSVSIVTRTLQSGSVSVMRRSCEIASPIASYRGVLEEGWYLRPSIEMNGFTYSFFSKVFIPRPLKLTIEMKCSCSGYCWATPWTVSTISLKPLIMVFLIDDIDPLSSRMMRLKTLCFVSILIEI